MEVNVTGCSDCPMITNTDYGETPMCNHPSANNGWGGEWQSRELTYDEANDKPDWCPLKVESITIKLV